MNDYTWYVVEVGYDTEKGFKKQAYAERVPNNYNLHHYFDKLYTTYGDVKGNVISVNACKTGKAAKEVAREWNENSRGLGVYLFA